MISIGFCREIKKEEISGRRKKRSLMMKAEKTGWETRNMKCKREKSNLIEKGISKMKQKKFTKEVVIILFFSSTKN